MLKKQKKHNITILWKDAVLYDAQYEPRTSLTLTKCRGEFVKEDKDFVILKNCRQYVFSKAKKKFIFKRKANFFFIPKGMITATHNGLR